MEPINFEMGGNTFSIPPWSYSFSGDNVNLPLCTIGVSYFEHDTDMPVIILGDSFLREFVTSYNYEENTITLGKNANAPKQTFPNNRSKVIWFFFSISMVVVSVGMFLLCVKNH